MDPGGAGAHAVEAAQETFVLYRAAGRIEKERAMRDKREQRLEEGLKKLQARLAAATRPEPHLAVLVQRLGLMLPEKPKRI